MDQKQKKIEWKIIVPWLLFFAAFLAAGYFWYQGSSLHLNTPQSAEEENAKIVKEVGDLIVLPTNEVPVIATVTDPSELGLLSTIAQKGEILLIYAQAQKAILYDPIAKKVIDIVPTGTSNASASSTSE